MRAAKERGEIEKIPGGRRAKGLPRLSKDPKIRKAQRIIEKAMAEQSKAAAVQANGNEAPVAWSDLSKAEKLSRATDVGLDRVYQTLTAPYDPTDLKQAQLVTNLALSVIGQQIRLDALKELQRGDVPAAKVDEEQRLLDVAFSDLGMGRRLTIEAPDDGEERAASEGAK